MHLISGRSRGQTARCAGRFLRRDGGGGPIHVPSTAVLTPAFPVAENRFADGPEKGKTPNLPASESADIAFALHRARCQLHNLWCGHRLVAVGEK